MATQSLTDVLADSVQSFLNILVEIHVAAVAIHNDYPRCDCNISQLSTTLATTVVRFRGDIKRHDDADSLARNCLKLGQDLSLRLDRVKEAQQFKSAENDLRAVWPAAAVDALGERIKTLQSSWSISRLVCMRLSCSSSDIQIGRNSRRFKSSLGSELQAQMR
jgi:hypothetical protein